MKKILSICFALVVAVMSLTVSVSAKDNVKEMPNVKVIIDGEIGSYKDIPILVNNRTLLPLREILVNLGVENDNDHIIWNGKEQSVTVKKDSKEIYLKVGSNKATVNDETIELDANPVIYMNKTYIPARFVAQSLGMKVVWDGSSQSVLIRAEKEFNQIKEYIDKANTAMSDAKSCKANMEMNIGTKQEGFSFNAKATGNINMDMKNKMGSLNMKMDLLGTSMDYDMYFADNTIYIKNPLLNKWQKATMSESKYSQIFEDNSTKNIYNYPDALCAGLKEVKSDDPNVILLKGDVFIGDLLNSAMQQSNASKANMDDVVFEKFNIELTLDKKTYQTKSMTFKTSFGSKELTESTNSNMKIDMDIKIDYTDYNTDIKIVIPKEAKDAEVDNTIQDQFN